MRSELTPQSVFVTGTDTGVGKTLIAAALLRAGRMQGVTMAGFKPVAAGCEQGQNADALLLQAESSHPAPYVQTNPYAFTPAIAPHLAAAQVGCEMRVPPICAAFAQHQQRAAAVVVEGAGGWLVPINATQTLADVAVALQLPVILVVGLRLGCLNHALLTAAAVRAAGLPLLGWVANHLSADWPWAADNVAALQARLAAPLLAEVPFLPMQDMAEKVSITAEKLLAR